MLATVDHACLYWAFQTFQTQLFNKCHLTKCHRSFPVSFSEIAVCQANCSEVSYNVVQLQILCLQLRFVQWCKLWVQSSSCCHQELALHCIGCSFPLILDRFLAVFCKPLSSPTTAPTRAELPYFWDEAVLGSTHASFLLSELFTSFGQNKIPSYSLTCHTTYNLVYTPFFPLPILLMFRLNCLILCLACKQTWNKISITLTPCSGIWVSYETCHEMPRVSAPVRFLLLPAALPVIWWRMI